MKDIILNDFLSKSSIFIRLEAAKVAEKCNRLTPTWSGLPNLRKLPSQSVFFMTLKTMADVIWYCSAYKFTLLLYGRVSKPPGIPRRTL
jgi:hypothetical protein